MASKYYAVRIGAVPGIYVSWDKCCQQVDGYPGAEYKAFKTMDEAQLYFREVAADDCCDIEPIQCQAESVVAYVDGSFDVRIRKYAFGCVIITPDGARECLSGTGANPQAISARNVAGELLGTMTAVKWAISHDWRKIVIYHDYTGIQKWYDHEWKAQSHVAKAYMSFMENYRTCIDITFRKVSAHTGVELNEEADRLAKEALGIGKKTE